MRRHPCRSATTPSTSCSPTSTTTARSILLTTTDGDVGVQLGDGHGAFGGIVTYIAGGAGFPMAIAVGDFDGDGHLDVIAPPLDSQVANVLLGDGTGAFSPVMIDHDGFPDGLAVADLDGDGRSDIVIPNASPDPDEIEVFHSTGSGAFTTRLYTAGIGAAPVVIGDLDRDGKLDLVDQLNNGDVAICSGRAAACSARPRPSRSAACRRPRWHLQISTATARSIW